MLRNVKRIFIMLLTCCVKIMMLLIFITQTLSARHVRARNEINIQLKTNEILSDLPSKKDMQYFLKSLERIIDFCNDHRTVLDLNLAFGLFLLNVNLKHINKNQLPASLRNRIDSLINNNERLLVYFDDTPERSNQKELKKLLTIMHEPRWTKRLVKLNINLLKDTKLRTRKHLNEIYGTVDKYRRNVDDLDYSVPKPRQSGADMCFLSLADHPINYSEYLYKCVVPEPCYAMLTNGSDFGYGLSHRLLFLQVARYDRGCSIFSPHQDDKMRRTFCAKAYNELEYIALHNYVSQDLMLEEICLCALDGHAQFLHRSWIYDLIRFQSPYGCFGKALWHSEYRTSKVENNETRRMENIKEDILNEECNIHITSVAAATLALAVRFISENYY